MGWGLLDSGALYRLVALAGAAGAASRSTMPRLSAGSRRHLTYGSDPDPAGEEVVWLDGRGRDARHPHRGGRQRRLQGGRAPGGARGAPGAPAGFAVPPGLVADGRDMGTVVFPGAQVKIFLTASLEERALRRHKQLKEKGVAATLAALSLEIAERDQRDITRSASPLVASADAVLLDTTGMSVDAVVERVLGWSAAP